jgi:glycyl-tRNA synthetase beta chain
MVQDGKEFTRLEGLIGSHYARAAGEDDRIVRAIAEHHSPRGPQDRLPKTRLGTLLSLADKMDLLAGCFLLGWIPTGSQDPYALRRHASGVLRILLERPWVRLDRLIERAVALYEGRGKAAPEEVREQLADFFRARLETLWTERGLPRDIARALLDLHWTVPGEGLARGRVLARFRGRTAFQSVIVGAKRVGNILEPSHRHPEADWDRLEEALQGRGELARGIAFGPDRLVEEAERGLWMEVTRAMPNLRAADEAGDFERLLHQLAELGPAIDQFFDEVLVNCPDEGLRRNRHAFLACLYALFYRFADFSKIEESRRG